MVGIITLSACGEKTDNKQTENKTQDKVESSKETVKILTKKQNLKTTKSLQMRKI